MLYASGADLQSINPLFTVHPLAKEVQKHLLFVTLAEYDSTLTPRPRLASWGWNADRTTLRLDLRSDVRWHDGVLTNADDVRMTLQLARDPATGYPRRLDLAAVSSIEVPDSATVILHFSTAQPGFPDVLTDLPILPYHLLGGSEPSQLRGHAFNQSPVGNGAFRFVEHRPNQRWVFERSDDFPSELGIPAVERFVVIVVDEAATKLAALTSGELDFAGISPAHAVFVAGDDRLEVVDYPVQFTVGLVWNLRRSPFDQLALRRALTMSIDRALLIDAYVYGYGALADGPVSPDHPWAAPRKEKPFDPVAGRALLDSLGWIIESDGYRRRGAEVLGFELLAVSSGDNALEQLIQAQLRDVGVEVRLRLLELSSFLDVAQSDRREFDALVVGVPGTVSLGHVAAMYQSEGGPLAYPGYESREFDLAVAAAADAGTVELLTAAWRQALAILERDLPTTWLYHSRGVQGKSRRILAPTPDLRGELAGVSEWSIRSWNP